MISATWRTVLGPRAHRTRRMASSASVGFRRGPFMGGIIYDSLRSVNTKCFVHDKDTKGTKDTKAFGCWLPASSQSGHELTEGQSATETLRHRDSLWLCGSFCRVLRLLCVDDGTPATNPATPRSDRSASRAP